MREGLSRLWLIPILVLFCAPLFVGLGNTDLQNDEAIYSFAAASILETGDWLNPRSSPHIEVVFLEKPPLKFWIVALPIRLGILPHNEFGLRFWDASFGGIALVYVFAIGRRMAGVLCGLVALLVLFTEPDLIFEHGLRNNTMEAPLFLAYAAGVYHFLKWGHADTGRARRWHAVAVGGWFWLGFMSKFVAVLFLPMVLACTVLASRAMRVRAREDLRLWTAILGGVVLLAAPWFVYQILKPGSVLWDVMFGQHVYARFTQGVDPSHVQPWHYYFGRFARASSLYGAPWLTATGAVLVMVDAWRRRSPEVVAVLVWFAIPIAVMSFSSSKLYHYAYPMLPPIALATGYAPARAFEWARAWLRGANLDRRFVPARAIRYRTLLTIVAVFALAIALLTVVAGRTIGVEFGPVRLRNTSIARPLFVALVAGLLAGRAGVALRGALLVVVLALLPIQQYKRTLDRLTIARHPWQTASDCLSKVAANEVRQGRPAQPVFAPLPEDRFLHPYFYYMRGVGPWDRAEAPPPDALLHARLHDPSEQRPIVIGKEWYDGYRRRTGDYQPAPAVAFEFVTLVMPGPYAACGPEVRRAAGG